MSKQSLIFCLGVVVLSLVFACAPPEEVAETPPAEMDEAASTLPDFCNPDPTCAGSTCPTEITSALAAVPSDACPREGEFQIDVDVYSWNTFIALNWPADTTTCTADTSRSVTDSTGDRVWQTYVDFSAVFEQSTPAAWCDQSAAASDAPRQYKNLTKVAPVVEQQFPGISEAFGHGPLTDQNGRWVRYNVRLNEDEYRYITTNEIYLKSKLEGFTVDFPNGTPQGLCNGEDCGDIGSIELKAAWKVLTDEEISSGRFYLTEGIVFNDASGSPSPGTNPVTLGLVGLHIQHKTATQASRFWSTFEQVDNTTSSFFNPDCSDCSINTQTVAKPYDTAQELDANGDPLNDPVQVTRVTPIEENAAAANAYYQGLLEGSVWEYYQLIATQWATGGAPDGTPQDVANTTLETYFQTTTNTCMGCHKGAETVIGTNADYSFTLTASH